MVNEKDRPSKRAARLQDAELILSRFRGRDDFVGVANDHGFAPEALAEPLTAERLADEHLAGERCIALYLMRLDNTVWCSALDFDNKPDRPDPDWKRKVEDIRRFLREHGLRPLIEISQSGSAAHVWLFFEEPVPAWLIRAFWREVLKQLGITVPEIYPRQDELTKKGFGNMLRFPLWGKSHFVNVHDEWKRVSVETAIRRSRPTSASELKRIADEAGFDLTPWRPEKQQTTSDGQGNHPNARERLSPRVRLLLRNDERFADRWAGYAHDLKDTSRSAIVMSLACMLVRRFIPTPEIEVALLCWCAEHGYEKGDRTDWIESVIENAYDLIGGDYLRKTRALNLSLPDDTPSLIRRAFRWRREGA
jgi:hypothetical protein